MEGQNRLGAFSRKKWLSTFTFVDDYKRNLGNFCLIKQKTSLDYFTIVWEKLGKIT